MARCKSFYANNKKWMGVLLNILKLQPINIKIKDIEEEAEEVEEIEEVVEKENIKTKTKTNR